jgi:Holliday junction resolvasome RuvABC endonuclease subunit
MGAAVCILALDPGHKLGYCVDGENPRAPRSGVCELPRNFPDYGKTWCYLETWLGMMIEQYRVTVLSWEAPIIFGGKRGSTRPTNSQAIEFAIGIGTVCELVGARRGLVCWKAPMGTVRLHFTGNGHADKGQVYARCLAVGYPVASYDAADATAIWDFTGHVYRRGGLVPGPLFADPERVRSIRRQAPALSEEFHAPNPDD